MDIASPGYQIYSTLPLTGGSLGNNYGYLSGTSMATPHVTGLATLLRAYNPNLSAEETRDVILNPASYDSFATYDRINTSGRINGNKTITNPKAFESPFQLNHYPVISFDTAVLVVTNHQEQSLTFQAYDPDNDPLRWVLPSIFEFDYTRMISKVSARNGLYSLINNTNFLINSYPFGWQLAGNMKFSASDNHGGGGDGESGFEIIEDTTQRGPIAIKTWNAQPDVVVNGFHYVQFTFDVMDDNKADYSYSASWTAPGHAWHLYALTPGPDPVRLYTATSPLNNAVRVFCMDKHLNFINSPQIAFPGANGERPPRGNVTITPQEGNAPLNFTVNFSGTVFDSGTTPLGYLSYDFGSSSISPNTPIQTYQFVEAGYHLRMNWVLDSREAGDMIVLPIAVSRYLGNAQPPPPPPPPPETNQLVQVNNLNSTLSGKTSIHLTWTDQSVGELSYIVESSSQHDGQPPSPFAVLANLAANSQSFTYNAPSRRTLYSFRVYPCAGTNCAPYSNITSVRTK